MFDEVLDSLFRKTRSPSKRRRSGTGLDKLQAAGDAAGIADQSGMVDLLNSGVSAVRAMRSKDPQERKEHWKDAGIRLVSAIPVFGDLAKLGRLKKYGELAKGARAETRASTSVAASGAGEAVAGAAKSGMRRPAGLTAQASPGPLRRFYNLMRGEGGASAERSTLGESRKAAVGENAPSSRQPGGLTPSELMGMGGKTRDQIDLADKEKRAKEESLIKQEQATAAADELRESLKKLTEGGTGAVVALMAMPKIVQRWSDALVESRRHLAKYDGRMAAAYARLDVDRVFRDMRTAQSTGGSSAELANSLSQLEESLRPLREMAGTLTNIVAILATGAATEIADLMKMFLSPLLAMQKAAEKFIGADRADALQSLPLHRVIQDMIDRGQFPQQPPAVPNGPLPPL